MATMNNFAQAIQASACKSDVWLDPKKAPSNKDFSLDSTSFFPHVQKVVLPPSSTIAIWGDLHGSAHSFVRGLNQLKNLKYINDDLTIANPQIHIVFLGDYVDRGFYAVEVLQLLMHLKIKNPTNVFLLRGNHEDISINKKWHFLKELNMKVGDIAPEQIQALYNLMPVGLYLGCPSETAKINYVVCCHGGLDFGFDPKPLLQNSQPHLFEKIEGLYLKTHFLKKLNSSPCSKNSVDAIKRSLQTMQGKYTVKQDFINLKPPSLRNFGFLWNDFNAHAPDENFVQWVRSWMLGKNITDIMLSWGNGATSTLRGVIRGHQHKKSMYPELWDGKGICRLWQGKVYTLFSSPFADRTDPIKLNNRSDVSFNCDSFIMVTTAQKFDDWTLTHWWNDFSRDEGWKWERYPFNG